VPRARKRSTVPPDGPMPWWGDRGTPPHVRWLGVTIDIPCGWSPERKRWESLEGKFYFDAEAADKACDFFPAFLSHSQGEFANQAFDLDDWQRCLIIRPLFGWKHVKTGLRRFRKLRLFIPKKNGKTQLAAGIALYLMFCDDEPGAQIVCAAADREQAKLIFDAGKSMVEDSSDLSEMAELYARSIVYGRNAMRVVSADVKTKHGPNISGLIFDEFHAQEKRDLYETLAKGVAARRQPIDAVITTAGTDQESICYEEYDYAKKVMQGHSGDLTVLPVIFEATLDDDWTDHAVWAKANPNLGKTVKLDYMAAEVEAAKMDPRKQNSFKNLHLNIWTQQETVWIPIEWWDACEVPEVGAQTFDNQAAGLDLSSKEDLTSFVIVRSIKNRSAAPLAVDLGRPEQDDDEDEDDEVPPRTLNVDFDVEIIPFFWMPEATLRERVKKDRISYDVWRDLGLLRVTEGPVVDYDQMFKDITEEIGPKYGLARDARGSRAPRDPKDHRGLQFGYDPWNIGQLPGALFSHGFLPVEVPQNVQRLSEPSKVLHALTKAGRAHHDGHRVMRYCMSNVSAKEDKKGNVFPYKTARNKRIDGALATIDGISRLIVLPVKKKRALGGGTALIIGADGVMRNAITGEALNASGA
jgi:phage terminase large subunit-like protein